MENNTREKVVTNQYSLIGRLAKEAILTRSPMGAAYTEIYLDSLKKPVGGVRNRTPMKIQIFGDQTQKVAYGEPVYISGTIWPSKSGWPCLRGVTIRHAREDEVMVAEGSDRPRG